MMRCLILDLTVQASTPLCNYILSITQKSDMIVSNPGSTTALVTTPRWPGRIRRSWDAAWFTTRGPNTMRLLLSATTLKVETSKVHCILLTASLAWLIIISCLCQGLKCTSSAPPALPAPPVTNVTMDSVLKGNQKTSSMAEEESRLSKGLPSYCIFAISFQINLLERTY